MRALLILALLAACGGGDDAPRPKTYGGDRPADLRTPAELTEGKHYPLVVILHGYGADGFSQLSYFHAAPLATNDQALVIAPDGLINSAGKQFWNAGGCCDVDGMNPDDVGYIGGLIDAIKADWPVDRVYLIGHSNGAFMAYRMACERADVIDGIAALAGYAATLPTCVPIEPVSVLHLHGTADDVVRFPPGPGLGAVNTVALWASYDGCGMSRTPTVTLDLDEAVDGSETTGETTVTCPAGVAVDLWTMTKTTHYPLFAPEIGTTLLDWLVAHTPS